MEAELGDSVMRMCQVRVSVGSRPGSSSSASIVGFHRLSQFLTARGVGKTDDKAARHQPVSGKSAS